MKLTARQIARMIDASAVRAEIGETQLRDFAEGVRKHQFIGAHVLPYYVSELKALLEGEPDILIGAPVGFPSGGHRMEVKLLEARHALQDGCRELDLVINVGALRSGRDAYVGDEIRAVVAAAGDVPVKVVLEVHHLTDDEIRRGCELCIQGGAAFVKTSTGWAPGGATARVVALIKSFVGNAIAIKASGGIRDLAALLEMHRLGASRFGLRLSSAVSIIEECKSKHGGVVDLRPGISQSRTAG